MPKATSIRNPKIQTPLYRRICAWCSTDLGELTYPSEKPSYGICRDCAQRYFPELFAGEEDELASRTLRERAVGGG